MPAPLTLPCCQPMAGTLASQQAHGTKATLEALTQLLNYCTMYLDAKVTWSSTCIAMPPTSLHPKDGPGLLATNFSVTALVIRLSRPTPMIPHYCTMVPSIYPVKSCAKSCQVLPKPNSVPHISMVKKLALSMSALKNLATPNWRYLSTN
jgi:hypothetical protein